jgi:hypothetical protein
MPAKVRQVFTLIIYGASMSGFSLTTTHLMLESAAQAAFLISAYTCYNRNHTDCRNEK